MLTEDLDHCCTARLAPHHWHLIISHHAAAALPVGRRYCAMYCGTSKPEMSCGSGSGSPMPFTWSKGSTPAQTGSCMSSLSSMAGPVRTFAETSLSSRETTEVALSSASVGLRACAAHNTFLSTSSPQVIIYAIAFAREAAHKPRYILVGLCKGTFDPNSICCAQLHGS